MQLQESYRSHTSSTVRYVLYARKSSESEDRQVQSIGDQVHALKELSVKLGLRIVGETTESKSAKDPGNRPGFYGVLEKIKRGEADGILCWNISRLSRNSIDSGQISHMLQKGEIQSIRTIDREYLPEDNVLLLAVESGFANQYVIDLRKYVKRGLYSKAEKGWYPGKPPPGYKNNKETREIDVDEKTFPLVREGWDMLLTGSYGVPQVYERLGSTGVLGVARSNAYKLFSNPFYCGLFKYGGSLYKGNHTPMVREDEFERVQVLLGKPGRIRPQSNEFAFTGLIRCGRCGCMVTATRKIKHYRTTGRTGVYTYYHCTRNKGCPWSAVREERIEEKVSEVLNRLRFDKRFVPYLKHVVGRIAKERPSKSVIAERERDDALKELKAKKERLLELRIAGELEASEFASYKSKLRDEQMQILAQEAREGNKLARTNEALERIVWFADTAYTDFCNGDEKTRRGVVVALSDSITLNGKELDIQLDPILTKLAEFEPPENLSGQVQNDLSADEKSLLYRREDSNLHALACTGS